MSKAHVCDTKLDSPLLLESKRSKLFFNYRENVRKTLKKYVTSLDYADRCKQ